MRKVNGFICLTLFMWSCGTEESRKTPKKLQVDQPTAEAPEQDPNDESLPPDVATGSAPEDQTDTSTIAPKKSAPDPISVEKKDETAAARAKEIESEVKLKETEEHERKLAERNKHTMKLVNSTYNAVFVVQYQSDGYGKIVDQITYSYWVDDELLARNYKSTANRKESSSGYKSFEIDIGNLTGELLLAKDGTSTITAKAKKWHWTHGLINIGRVLHFQEIQQ